MRMIHRKFWSALPIILLIQTSPSVAQTACSAAEVKLGNNHIQVAPTGADDTENIQCALDLAVERNMPEIRLTRGEFFVGSLFIQDFAGTLQGGGRDHTRITLLEQSIDCAHTPAAITFARGEPRIRWLSMRWPQGAQPCSGANDWLETLVKFTGASDGSATCGNDVIYATVDRVRLEGPTTGSADAPAFSSGVRAVPKTSADPECTNLLLGTLRVNRSSISGFGTGVGVKMEGGAQVGIFQSVLDGNHTAVSVDISDAVVTVSGNHFASTPVRSFSSCHEQAVGIWASNDRSSEGITRLDIHGNTFEVADFGSSCRGLGIRLMQNTETLSNNVVISNNRFHLSSTESSVTGIQASGVSRAVVNNNIFDQQSRTALSLVIEAWPAETVYGWSVVSNGFIGPMIWDDIILGENTSNSIVGPGQAASVLDNGFDNIVLPQ